MSDIEIKDTFQYRSTDIAEYLIAFANARNIGINMTKVQKLLYITYGVYLRIHKERLLNEHPQAWPYGPVFPSTRNKLLKQDILSLSEENIENIVDIKADKDLDKIIQFVFDNFGEWNAGQLSEWSHSEESPWDKTRRKKGFNWGDVIPDDLIYEYFCSIITVKSDIE